MTSGIIDRLSIEVVIHPVLCFHWVGEPDRKTRSRRWGKGLARHQRAPFRDSSFLSLLSSVFVFANKVHTGGGLDEGTQPNHHSPFGIHNLWNWLRPPCCMFELFATERFVCFQRCWVSVEIKTPPYVIKSNAEGKMTRDVVRIICVQAWRVSNESFLRVTAAAKKTWTWFTERRLQLQKSFSGNNLVIPDERKRECHVF